MVPLVKESKSKKKARGREIPLKERVSLERERKANRKKAGPKRGKNRKKARETLRGHRLKLLLAMLRLVRLRKALLVKVMVHRLVRGGRLVRGRSRVLAKARKVVLMVSLSRLRLIRLRRNRITPIVTAMRAMPLRMRVRVDYRKRKLTRKRLLLLVLRRRRRLLPRLPSSRRLTRVLILGRRFGVPRMLFEKSLTGIEIPTG
jgi:hypothetical protein